MGKNIKDLFNATAYDKNGEKLGDVNEVFVDDQSGQPTFVEVNHGLFGMNSSLVPLRGHDFSGDDLKLGFSKDRIKDAPDFDSDKPLTPEAQSDIFKHYGLDNAHDVTDYKDSNLDSKRDAQAGADKDHNLTAGAGAAGAGAGVAGAGAAGAHADEKKAATHTTDAAATERKAGVADDAAAARTNNDGELIRSEEQLNVNKERVATGEARLRKYVVTDTETVEVPVEREEVSVERTPISAEDAKNYNGTISGDSEEASVTLHEERVNVNKETVPVEKINLKKDTVRDTETHTEELRKEQIDTDGVDGLKK
ncbi:MULTISPECIES: PRC and DUF2382 domain-containing protein [Corynebacterium]|uniref:PRC and DUF2382 domain-containing protein n=3 Tax=Corynebacterium TaxID=1716 RepID=A0A7Y9ZVY6_9CORY|nr:MULTISPECIES: PRC and DUF2382 domain-containing protein [Corynebacterium]EET77616.1 hypothetical protein CORTU0001_1852 [Corynebacterium tuberculostearicum SK141]EFQ80332.1 hypothetical protein HMPREF0305_11498 [Corynebacterium pseudogenitalium ATCC 33035]MBK3426918.1 PRC and DUF2382 domain-containing protein [Corynebacterium tuberculostearicum]MCF8712753.1 PRC and DUF2382 domain-containing protein [Corynebacterium parakroppenstedtii]MDV2421564.1 PRC and DUF2382 domain-containing protein [C